MPQAGACLWPSWPSPWPCPPPTTWPLDTAGSMCTQISSGLCGACTLCADRLQANTCILVHVVMVTASSARHGTCTLSPQPCLQQQISIQIWGHTSSWSVLPTMGRSRVPCRG